MTGLDEAEGRWVSIYKCLTPDGFNQQTPGVPVTVAQRQARSRTRRAKAGGKIVQAMLTPKASAKLSAWQAKGETAAGVISRLLERSRP